MSDSRSERKAELHLCLYPTTSTDLRLGGFMRCNNCGQVWMTDDEGIGRIMDITKLDPNWQVHIRGAMGVR